MLPVTLLPVGITSFDVYIDLCGFVFIDTNVCFTSKVTNELIFFLKSEILSVQRNSNSDMLS